MRPAAPTRLAPLLATLLAALAPAACGGDPAPGAADPARNEAIVEAFAHAMNEHDWAALDTLLVEEYVRHSQATPEYAIASRADFVQFARDDAGAFPDARLELERLVTQDDEVAFWGTYHGTQSGPMGVFRATGETVELQFSGIHRIENGRIAETWVTWDNLAALVQLGHWEVTPAAQPPAEARFCAVWIAESAAEGTAEGGRQTPLGPAPVVVPAPGDPATAEPVPPF